MPREAMDRIRGDSLFCSNTSCFGISWVKYRGTGATQLYGGEGGAKIFPIFNPIWIKKKLERQGTVTAQSTHPQAKKMNYGEIESPANPWKGFMLPLHQ